MIIGITTVVIAIVYFVVSSGKTPPPTIAKEAPVSPIPVAVAPMPAPETRPAVKTPSRDDRARTEWLGIQEFAKTHADDYLALLDRLKSGAELARDTAVAPQIADEQKSVEARWAESFGKVLKTQTDLANAAAAKSDFAGAINALNADAVPENLRVLQWHEQLDAGRNGIREKADTAVKAVLDAARALAAGNDETGLKNALEKLKSADAIPADLAASSKSIGEERTRWTAQLGIVQLQAEAAKKDRLDKAQAAVAAVRKELAPVLAQSHFSAALELLENKLHDPALANGKELLNAEKSDLEGVIALRQRALDAIHASVGKTLTLNRGKTTITGKVGNDASGKSVTLQLAEGPEMAIGVDQLEARDINALAPAIGDGAGKAEDLRRRGVMFLDVGDLNKAKDYFKSARDAGLGDAVKRYLDAIENMELGEVEVRARRDWADADVLFQAKRWTDAQRSYTLFKEADGKTKFFAEVANELKVRLETIDMALNPLRPGLVATYYHNNDFKESERILQRIDANVNFDWNNTPPAKEVPHDQYSVRWVGSIKIPKAGHYTFATEADDGARLWIDGKVLINDWTTHGVTRFAGEIDLTEGLHEIRVEFFQAGGGSSIQMKWTLRGSPEAIVPAEALVHDPKLETKK